MRGRARNADGGLVNVRLPSHPVHVHVCAHACMRACERADGGLVKERLSPHLVLQRRRPRCAPPTSLVLWVWVGWRKGGAAGGCMSHVYHPLSKKPSLWKSPTIRKGDRPTHTNTLSSPTHTHPAPITHHVPTHAGSEGDKTQAADSLKKGRSYPVEQLVAEEDNGVMHRCDSFAERGLRHTKAACVPPLPNEACHSKQRPADTLGCAV